MFHFPPESLPSHGLNNTDSHCPGVEVTWYHKPHEVGLFAFCHPLCPPVGYGKGELHAPVGRCPGCGEICGGNRTLPTLFSLFPEKKVSLVPESILVGAGPHGQHQEPSSQEVDHGDRPATL